MSVEPTAVADRPDGYGMRTVRLSGTGEVIGTINFDDQREIWIACRPDDDGSDATTESSANDAVAWLLGEYIRETSGRR